VIGGVGSPAGHWAYFGKERDRVNGIAGESYAHAISLAALKAVGA